MDSFIEVGDIWVFNVVRNCNANMSLSSFYLFSHLEFNGLVHTNGLNYNPAYFFNEFR